MRRPAGLLAGALIAIAVLPVPSATAAPAASTAVLKTAGRVLSIAADGGRVAVATAATTTSCDRIVVWKPAKKTTSGFAYNVSSGAKRGRVVFEPVGSLGS